MTSIRGLGLCAGVLAGALLASNAGAVTFSAYQEFAISGGAIAPGNFAFGYLDAGEAFTGALKDYSRFDQQCDGNANFQCAATFSRDTTPGVYKAAGAYATGTVVFQPGELNLHTGPAGELSAVQFIAPTAGVYRFAGDFSLNDYNPTSVSLAAYVGTTGAFSTVLGGAINASHAFDFSSDLAAGELVTFVVGPNGGYSNDSTGLALSVTTGVPEPHAWALMIVGFGGAGAILRRRVRYA